MRPDRTAAQVLLILYAVGCALAVPAGVRERYRDPAEDVRARDSVRDDDSAQAGLDSSPHFNSNPAARASSAGSVVEPDNRFFDETLRTKIFRYTILGAIAGISSGLISGVQKDIFGSITPGAYVSTLFTSSHISNL